MGKLSIVAGLAALGFSSVAAPVMAACPGSASTASVLSGKTVCVTKVNGDRFQEYHAPGGALIDYKKGPPAPGNIDPTKQVGTWAPEGNDVVYGYGAGGTYRYTVFVDGGNYCLSGNGEEIQPSAVLDGQVACP